MEKNIIQEVALGLHVIRQMHEGSMEAQRQSFQLELERMGGKVEQLESEVQALKVSGQQLARNRPLAKAVAPSGSNGQEERERRQTEQSEDQDKSQKHRQINTHMVADRQNQHVGSKDKNSIQVIRLSRD